jgi:hypothetical protein
MAGRAGSAISAYAKASADWEWVLIRHSLGEGGRATQFLFKRV